MMILWSFVAVFLVFLGWVVFFGAPWVPSHKRDVKKAFTELYKLGKDDLVVDLGAGDGKVLKIASKYGAKGFGIELNPFLFLVAKLRLLGVKGAQMKLGNYLTVQLPRKTTVVYVFGDGRDITRVYNRVKEEANRLGRTLFLISYAFPVPKVKEEDFDGTSYLYRIK